MSEEPVSKYLRWTVLKKFLFLFFSIYILLYAFSFLFNPLVLWTGKHILGLHDLIKIQSTGSGDTTFDYVRLFTLPILSLIITLIILLFDRKRSNYHKLLYWIFALTRYYVGFFMLTYGFAKVFKSQFSFPGIVTLEQTYGESSPMHLLWTFMGYSTGYTFFSGMMEVIGGLLLFYRKTTALGALITTGVMANVVMLNFCYDVPVKIFSLHLLIFAVFLLIPDAKAVFDFFIRNKSAALSDYYFPCEFAAYKRAINITKFLLIGSFVIAFAMASFKRMNNSDNASKSPLYGIYKTELFIRNNDTLPPLTTDTIRWSKLFIGKNKMRTVLMNDSLEDYSAAIDTTKGEIKVELVNDISKKYNTTYSVNDSVLIIQGKWKNDSVFVKLQKVDKSKYPLIGRGFHWVNEYPYNK